MTVMKDGGAIDGLEWIAVDWGTSRLRVRAIGRDNAVLASRVSDDGMGRLSRDRFEPVLLDAISGWLPSVASERIPVVICGMAGSAQGWREAPYREIPCTPVTARSLMPVPCGDNRVAVSIVPGLCQRDPDDVMRGEETQLAGLLALGDQDGMVVCMPGSHSKWVKIESGEVVAFRTVMTGELYATISEHTILRHSVTGGEHHAVAFETAVRDMLDQPDALVSSLFGVRAGGLLRGNESSFSRSRLSGLLIGAELASVREFLGDEPVHIVGDAGLAALYREALATAGHDSVIEASDDLTIAGLATAVGAGEEKRT